MTGHGWDVKTVEWHPYKSLIVSGSKDNLIKLWDPRTGNSLSTLYGHKNTVMKVCKAGVGSPALRRSGCFVLVVLGRLDGEFLLSTAVLYDVCRHLSVGSVSDVFVRTVEKCSSLLVCVDRSIPSRNTSMFHSYQLRSFASCVRCPFSLWCCVDQGDMEQERKLAGDVLERSDHQALRHPDHEGYEYLQGVCVCVGLSGWV